MRTTRAIGSLIAAALLLAGCAARPPPAAPDAWPLRLQQLQAAQAWDLAGRAAGAVGSQGWQANLNWQQAGELAHVRLSGPLGAGALALSLGPSGLTIDAPADGAASPPPADLLEQRLGFSPPFARLRYWLLGVPAPGSPFDLTRNAEERAAHIGQDGWEIDYTEYMRVGADVLPRRLTLRHEAVRVRVAVDRWTAPR